MFNLVRAIMTLAEKIAVLTEQEKREGMAIVVACEGLKTALAESTDKLVAAQNRIAELVAGIGDIPQLQAQVASLSAELNDARRQLAEADEAANLISAINEPIDSQPVE